MPNATLCILNIDMLLKGTALVQHSSLNEGYTGFLIHPTLYSQVRFIEIFIHTCAMKLITTKHFIESLSTLFFCNLESANVKTTNIHRFSVSGEGRGYRLGLSF